MQTTPLGAKTLHTELTALQKHSSLPSPSTAEEELYKGGLTFLLAPAAPRIESHKRLKSLYTYRSVQNRSLQHVIIVATLSVPLALTC